MSSGRDSEAPLDKSIAESLTIANWPQQMMIILDHARDKYGAVAEMLNPNTPTWTPTEGTRAVDSPRAPWHGEKPEAIAKIAENAPKLLGMLTKCMDLTTKDTISNEGAMKLNRLDYVATILAIRECVEKFGTGPAAVGLQDSLYAQITTSKAPKGQDPARFIASFLGWKSRMDVRQPRLTEYGFATALLSAMSEHSDLHMELTRPGIMPEGGYATTADLITKIRIISNWMNQSRQSRASSKQAGGAAYAALDTDEVAAVAKIDKKATEGEAKTKLHCEFCFRKGFTCDTHNCFKADGTPHCHGLMRQLKKMAEEKEKDKSSKDSKDIKKNAAYSTSSTPTYHAAHYTTTEVAASWEIAMKIHAQSLPKGVLISDPGASATILNDKRWFSTLRDVQYEVSGVAGAVTITQEGDTVFGVALYSEQILVNLVSTNALHKRHYRHFHVAYDWNDNTFHLTGPEIDLTFATTPSIPIPHVVMQPRAPTAVISVEAHVTNHIAHTAIDNSRAAQRAAQAVELHRKLLHMPYATMKRTLRAGALTTDLTAGDVAHAERLYGPCPACISGRSHHETRGGQYDTAEHAGEHLRCDVVHIRGFDGVKKPFHLAVDERTSWTHLNKMNGLAAADLLSAQRDVISYLRARGHEVRRIYYDDDTTAKATKVDLGILGVQLRQWTATQHEPVAENRCRTLTRDMRTACSDLPYILPEACISHCAQDCVAMRSLVCNVKTGMETPHSLVEDAKPAMRLDTCIPFGAIVMATLQSLQGLPLAGTLGHAIVVRRHPAEDGKYTVFFLHNQSFGERQLLLSDVVDPGEAVYAAINNMSSGPYDMGSSVSTSSDTGHFDRHFIDDIHRNVLENNAATNALRNSRRSRSRRAPLEANPTEIALNEDRPQAQDITTPLAPAPIPVAIPTPRAIDNAPNSTTEIPTQSQPAKGAGGDRRAPLLNSKEGDMARKEDEGYPQYKPNPRRQMIADANDSNTTSDNDSENDGEEFHTPMAAPNGTQLEEDSPDDSSSSEEEVLPVTVSRRARTPAAIPLASGSSLRSRGAANAVLHGKHNVYHSKHSSYRNSKRGRGRDGQELMMAALAGKLQPNLEAAAEQQRILAMVMQLNQLVQQGEDGVKAARKEIRNILDTGALRPEYASKLTEKQRKESITSFLFGKRKLSGELKGRMVENGKQLQKRPEYQNLFSPTSNPLTTMTHLTVASHQRRKHVFSVDFPGAYLKVDRAKHNMPTEYTRITGQLAKLFVAEEPSLAEYLVDGTIYFELIKSVYGLTESAALWYKELRDMLIGLGYIQQDVDPCLFIHPTLKSSINIHVDDCLVTCDNDAEAARLKAFFDTHKCTIKVDDFTFLGMDVWRRNDGIIQVSMQKFLAALAKEWRLGGKEDYPTRADFTDEDSSGPSPRRNEYVSKVMALLYAAIRVRFDILFAVANLSRHCAVPSEKNYKDLEHLLRYVNGSLDKAITLHTDSLNIHVWADASFMTHADRKGQTGVAVTLGEHGPCIAPKSSKAKIVTLSSTESESLAAFEATPLLQQTAELMKAFRESSIPILHQDNQSAIAMAESGGGTSKHTKHFDLRLKYLQQLITDNAMHIVFTPTEKMIADVFTKNVTGKKFNSYMEALMCNKHEIKRERKDALLAYFVKLSMPTLRGRARTNVRFSQ